MAEINPLADPGKNVSSGGWVSPAGESGLQGPQGTQGTQGTQGIQGVQGDTGAQGPQGVKGDTGDTGPQGVKGDTGNTGAQGPQGIQGPVGAGLQIQGHVADAASLPTGLTTADAGKAWVTDDTGHTWTWSGTAWVDVGALEGAPGADGPPGPAGADGPEGPGYRATSTTSDTISLGPHTFTVPAGLAYTPGARVRVASQSDPEQWMEGECTAYSGTSLTINVDDTSAIADPAGSYVSKAGDTMTGDLTVNKNTPTLILNKTASDQNAMLYSQVNGSSRWAFVIGDNDPETGGNVGTNFAIGSYADNGSYLRTPLRFDRATGLGVVSGNPVAALGIATKQYVDTHPLSTHTVLNTVGSGTYTTPANCRRLKVRLLGGGAGGSSFNVNGQSGGNTIFGPATAGGGQGTGGYYLSGAGGVVTGCDFAVRGASASAIASANLSQDRGGGTGASGPFGGAGAGSWATTAAGAASANSGSGGGGGGSNGSSNPGAGGAAGGYGELVIDNPAASYSYTVGAGGLGATAGTNSGAGGAGGSGVILIEAIF